MAGVQVNECEFCFGTEEVRTTGRFTECRSCREYREYYESLSPEEKRAEHESVARHYDEALKRRGCVTSCSHRQADPVVLTTGETVATICTSCYKQLPVDFIDKQRDRAWVMAICKHVEEVEVRTFGEVGAVWWCTACGGERTFL